MIPKKQKPKTSCWARLFCCCLSSAFTKKDTLKNTDNDDLESFKYTENSSNRKTNFQEDDSASRSNYRIVITPH